MTGVHVVPLVDGEPQSGHDVELPEEVRTVGLGSNPEFDATTLRLGYTSLVTPGSVYDYDIDQRGAARCCAARRCSVGSTSTRTSRRASGRWPRTAPGSRSPWSGDVGLPRDGTAPFVLYGYGSYEASMDPWFSIARLSLLDRGFGFAVAHIRGGGEMGRRWYEDGKLLAKRSTFTDFLACADRLVEAGWSSADRIVARGGSAGGLLMGAVANLAPEKFAAIIAEVPFVDALNTILDPSLPLTVMEWEEWGNPVDSQRGVRLHAVLLAVRERRGQVLPGDPGHRRPQRPPRERPRAGQVGGQAAGDADRRPAVAAEDGDGRRAWRAVRSLRRLA